MQETFKGHQQSFRVFSAEGFPGSLQFLHGFSDINEMNTSFEKYYVTDEFDHTFYTKIGETEYGLRFKNKNGEFSLCGSGAYALAMSLPPDNLVFKTKSSQILVNTENQKTWIGLEIQNVTEVPAFNARRLFYNEDTGVYLMNAHTKEDLCNSTLINTFVADDEIKQKHGLCVFYCEPNSPKAYLRYFSPWHGRDEDYVTGSIHHTLSPLAYKLTHQSKRIWVQNSTSPGIIESEVIESRVWLSEVSPEVSPEVS